MSTHGGTSTSAPPATTVTGPDTIGHAAVVGTGLHYARNDHDHGLPILDYNSMQYNDLLGWTFDPACNNTQTALPAAATIYLGRIPLPAVTTITNIAFEIGTLGLVLTHSYVALFKSDGTVIGQSADQSAVWGTGGSLYDKYVPLAGGPFVCTPIAANDFVWAAIYVGTSTGALPQFMCGAQYFSNINTGSTKRYRFGAIAQANTAALVSFSPSGLSAAGIYPWLGIS